MTFKKIKLIGTVFFAGVAILVIAAFLDYNLPHHSVVQVINADVLRYDPTDVRHRSLQGGTARDIYQIFTEDPKTRKQYVFQNEDTAWSFPWYFKFNSADLQSMALSISTDKDDRTALITYYGWRSTVFSMFPNVVDIKKVPPGYWAFPWFNTSLLLIFVGLVGFVWFRIYRRRRGARGELSPHPVDAGA